MRIFQATCQFVFEFDLEEDDWSDDDIKTHIEESLYDRGLPADEFVIKEVPDIES